MPEDDEGEHLAHKAALCAHLMAGLRRCQFRLRAMSAMPVSWPWERQREERSEAALNCWRAELKLDRLWKAYCTERDATGQPPPQAMQMAVEAAEAAAEVEVAAVVIRMVAAALHQQRSKAATEWAQQTKTRSMAVRPTAALHPQRSRFI
jgi:hypothetical protein